MRKTTLSSILLMAILASICTVVTLSHSAYAGKIYTCKNAKGKPKFQDRPCQGIIEPEVSEQTTLSHENLNGRWMIVGVGDQKVDGTDFWEFNGNRWTAISSGKRLRPENFSINGQDIDFGSYKITVIELTTTTMKVKTLGITQTLEKQR